MKPVRVFVIGRRTMCVEGLAAILSASDAVEYLGSSSDWADGLARVEILGPDVVVVDMAHCTECGPRVPVSVVEALADRNVVLLGLPDIDGGALNALEAGALGYLSLNGQGPSEAVRVITTVAGGEAALDTRTSTTVLSRMRQLSHAATTGGRAEATPSEREGAVLALLAAGRSNREIAQELHISESTVKNHLHTLYSKLGVESRSQAVSEAIRRGLVTP